MRRFELLEPRSFDAAVALLAERPEAKAIAGGTALLILIKHGIYLPEALVNLRKIPGMADITFDAASGLRIGALATINDVERSPLVREHYPLLAEACHVVANIRIRNLATVGGNLAHADYQSDPPGALVALDARLELQGPDGVREVALSEFLLGAYETTLVPAELVRAVLLPAHEPGWHGAYLKFTTRSSEDRPAAGVSALLRFDGGRCTDARVVAGAATPVPARLTSVEDALRGAAVDAAAAAGAGRLAESSIEPIDDLRGSARYKQRVVGALVERAILQCAAQGGAA